MDYFNTIKPSFYCIQGIVNPSFQFQYQKAFSPSQGWIIFIIQEESDLKLLALWESGCGELGGDGTFILYIVSVNPYLPNAK